MTSILMCLFANDFGFFTMGKGVIVLYILSFAFPFVFSMIFTKIDDFISLQLMGICFFLSTIFIIVFGIQVSPEYIPQYGTQSQKQMLLLCLKHEKNNKLSDDEQKHISNTINNIMETCYKNHLKNEQYVKKLLEEQKQELKDKEVLDSLNKMMAN